MDLRLQGKVAVITGGASGLGKATAEELAREGAKLLLADRDESLLAETAGSLEAGGTEVTSFVVDVRDYSACTEMVATAEETLGPVDILVNSAGIGDKGLLFVETSPDDWQDTVAINLIGVMNCCRAVADGMISRGSGKIVSLASEAGKGNEKRMIVYGTSKGGVISFTRGLALEMGRHSINVNCVCPGVTRTPMTEFITDEMEREWSKAYPLGRLGRPGDIAPLIAFLASDRASWITGQAISVNGGFGRS